jgi:hypothetical protein
VDELPKVIWSHNTTISRATGFTPFRLLFGTEAMTPEEIKNESMRVLKGKEIEEIDKKVEKDMIELTILEAAENIEKYQRETRAWRDKKVVRVGDSPRGPLKQRGNPHLNPQQNQNTLSLTMQVPNHAGHGPRCRDPDGPSRRPS